MIQGAIVAIVTPFRNGKVDEEALRRLIEEQIAGRDGRHRALRHHGRIDHPLP